MVSPFIGPFMFDMTQSCTTATLLKCTREHNCEKRLQILLITFFTRTITTDLLENTVTYVQFQRRFLVQQSAHFEQPENILQGLSVSKLS